MKQQNNNIEYLRLLWKNNIISHTQYFFRKKCNELNIKTYEQINEHT